MATKGAFTYFHFYHMAFTEGISVDLSMFLLIRDSVYWIIIIIRLFMIVVVLICKGRL